MRDAKQKKNGRDRDLFFIIIKKNDAEQMSVASAADNWRRPLAGTCRQRPSFSEFYRVIFFPLSQS